MEVVLSPIADAFVESPDSLSSCSCVIASSISFASLYVVAPLSNLVVISVAFVVIPAVFAEIAS